MQAYDPQASGEARRERPDLEREHGLRYCESALEAARGADALLILTDWPEFRMRRSRPIASESMTRAFILDGRNLLNAERLAPPASSTVDGKALAAYLPRGRGERRQKPVATRRREAWRAEAYWNSTVSTASKRNAVDAGLSRLAADSLGNMRARDHARRATSCRARETATESCLA